MVFHWSLSDSMSPQVSRTFLSILAVLNIAAVWMVSAHPRTSGSSSPFNYPLVTVPKAPITLAIIVPFMFHSFFSIHKQGPGTYPYYYYFIPLEFFTLVLADGFSSYSYRRLPMVSHCSDSKSSQIFRTLLSILADLNSAVVWIVSTRSLIFKSCSLCTNHLVIVLRTKTTVGITVTFLFHSFFNPLARSTYLSFFLLSFNFTR